MSDVPPPPPPPSSPPPPPPPPGGGFTPPPPPPPPPPPSGGGFVPPPPVAYTPGAAAGYAGPRTDGLAIGALIVGILSLVCSAGCLGILLGPAAAIMGFVSRNRIAASGGAVSGGGLALAGLILGIVGFVASAGVALAFLLSAANSSSGG